MVVVHIYNGLRILRKSKSISCLEMGIVLGITKSSYSKKEKGTVKFSLKEAKMVADYLGRSIDYIFFDSEVSEMEIPVIEAFVGEE